MDTTLQRSQLPPAVWADVTQTEKRTGLTATEFNLSSHDHPALRDLYQIFMGKFRSTVQGSYSENGEDGFMYSLYEDGSIA